MIKLTQRKIIAVFVAVLGLYMLKSQQQKAEMTLQMPVLASKATSSTGVVKPQVASDRPAEPVLNVDTSMTSEDVKSLQPHLEQFVQLKSKVIKNTEEQKEFLSLLKDKRVLQWSKNILRARTTTHKVQQDQALTLVLESMKSGEGVAQEILAELIADNAVEDQSLDVQVRQHVAELKAEAMYEWASHAPAQAQEIANLLPGPVSRTIWRNVRLQQNNNLDESQLEL
jgi:hypothetical protein